MRSMRRTAAAATGRGSHRRTRSLVGTALLAGVLSLAACDGDNLFSGTTPATPQGAPAVVSVTVPEVVAEGSRLDVSIAASAPRGLASVQVRYRRALTDDQTFEFENRTDTVAVNASVQIPAEAADTVVVIEVTATDRTGAVSDAVTRSVRVSDASPPSVTVSSSSSMATPGGVLELSLSARDLSGLQEVGYAVLSSEGDTILQNFVPTTGAERDTTFLIELPTALRGDLSVYGFATNTGSLRGVSSAVVLALNDTVPPHVRIIRPTEGESYARGIPLRVRVELRDSTSGLQELRLRGVAFRNFPDSLQNTTPVDRFEEVVVPFPQGPDRPLPIDTIIVRDLRPLEDTTTEPVYIIARALDAAGNAAVDTIRVVPGASIVILNPNDGTIARINSDLQVRVEAADPAAGIDSIRLHVAGVVNDTIVRRGLAGTFDPVQLTHLVRIGGETGTIELTAAVWNSVGTRSITPQPVVVTVSEEFSGDTVAPSVLRVVDAPARVELQDTITVRVQATDEAGTGIARMGAVVVVIPANESAELPRDTFFLSTSEFASPRTGTPDTTFAVRLGDRYGESGSIQYPQAFTFQVHAFAIDGQGNCGASVQPFYQSLDCRTAGGGTFVAEGQSGAGHDVVAVLGTSLRLPTGSVIADAIADTTNQRVYLSNFARNQLEVLNLADTTFGASVLVGSQPWGLFLVPGRGAPDTLMVANSGGTNISFVPTSTLREDAGKRLLTPNEVLWEITESTVNGYLRYSVNKLEFSDRPQFIAQDSNGVILYSTLPTSAALEGTIRRAIADPTPADPNDDVRPETGIIFGREAITQNNDAYAVARVDSIFVVVGGASGDDQVTVYDHDPGRPTSTFSFTGYPWDALAAAEASGRSDLFYDRGNWNRGSVGFSDTTYVAPARDLGTIAFGEGAAAPFGRIVLWSASPDPLQPELGRVTAEATEDLIGNAAEAVMGVGLNIDGSFGVARGLSSTYFFSNDVKQEGQLRLQGVFADGVEGGNGGAALHPHHGTIRDGSTATTLAFIATGNRSIKIIDTFHYFERGEVPIRDNIVGQLRATPVPPGTNDPVGNDPDHCDFAIARLVGVTDGNSVVIVNVRNKDIQRNAQVACTR